MSKPRGHSNINGDGGQIGPWEDTPDKARIPLIGGATANTCKALPPLALDRDEWANIGAAMGWDKPTIYIAVSYREDAKNEGNNTVIEVKTELWGPVASDEEADKVLAEHYGKVRQFKSSVRGYNYSYIPLKVTGGVPVPYKLPRDEGGYHPYHVHYVSKSLGTPGFLINARSDALWVRRGDDSNGQYARPEEIQVGDTVHIPRAEGREEFGVVERVEKKPLFWNDGSE